MLRATLDTNVLLEYWKQQDKRDTVKTLLIMSEDGQVDLAVTARVRQDIPNDPLASKLNGLQALGISEVASVARLDYLVLDRDMLGSQEFVGFYQARGSKEPDWRDWDHLHAHMLQRRDVFLTWDRKILSLASELRDRFGIRVNTPEEFISSFPVAHMVLGDPL